MAGYIGLQDENDFELLIPTAVYTSPVSYPESLDITATSHDDFSSLPSQVSSYSSLSISQPQLINDYESDITRLSEVLSKGQHHKMSSDEGADTSTETDMSEWEEPQTESEVHIVIQDNNRSYSESNGEMSRRIELATDEAISNAVWRHSIMFGPLDDSDYDDDDNSFDDSYEAETSSDDNTSGILLDQSTLTTTTSYITVLAIDEQKEDDGSDTKSITDATGGMLQNSFIEQERNSSMAYSHLNGIRNDESEEPPISSMLSDALEEMERAEISGEEQEEELQVQVEEEMTRQIDHLNDDDTLKLVNEKVVPPLTANTRDVAINSINVSTPTDTLTPRQMDETFDFDISSTDKEEPIDVSVKDKETIQPLQGPTIFVTEGNNKQSSPSSSKTSTKSAGIESNDNNDLMNLTMPELVSSSSGDLLVSYSKEDMLASSDIMLGVSYSRDDLLVESELSFSQSGSVPETDKWELPIGTTVDEKLTFLMDKICQLKNYQGSILKKLRNEQQHRREEVSKQEKTLESIITKIEKDEASRKQERKRQKNRVELIENAVIELGKHYTGQYQPLLGVKPQRKSSISHQKAEKLKNFFGAQPPLLHQFLKDLGYEEYIPRFQNEKIGLKELPYLKEEDLVNLSLPLGPRLRILHEARQL